MPLFVVAVAFVNLALGFALAIHLGAAPGLNRPKNPVLAKLWSLIPKRKAKPLH
jgi:hypothetical protein